MYEELFTKPNVNLVGYGYRISRGERVGEGVVVGVRKKMPLAALAEKDVIPQFVYGLRTDVFEVGEIMALKARTEKWRPAPGGVSIGHYKITAGTLGTAVKDLQTNDYMILSNNHVLANSNDAELGDPILQPGPIDGGKQPDDVIGYLARYIPIQFLTDSPTCPVSQSYARFGNLLSRLLRSSHKFQTIKINEEAENKVDAAVCNVKDTNDISFNIIDIGAPYGIKEVALGYKIKKSGRTTETTEGQVIIVDATVNVNYGGSKYAKFVNQIVGGPMSSGGDSGSLGVTEDGFAFGLLFAGSDQVTIFNPIKEVVELLKIKF